MSYVKFWKMVLLKCCSQYISKFGKLSSGHRTGKCQFSFQSQRRTMPNNIQTIIQRCSFHIAWKVLLKILLARFQQYVNQECPDIQAGFQKGRRTRGQIANLHRIMRKARTFQEKRKSTSASLTILKPLTYVDHKKTVENS